MTSGEAEKMLLGGLRAVLQSFGFIEHSPMSYFRAQADRIEILNFGGRMDRGSFRFSLVVGVRFPAVESILRPENTNPTYPTIAAPIHFLRADRQFFEWEFADEKGLALAIESVCAEVEELAAFFFERYDSLRVVEQDLKLGPDGAEFHMLGREQIVAVLAAISKLEGRPEDAMKIVEDALADPRNSKPANQRRLEQLKVQISQQERCQA